MRTAIRSRRGIRGLLAGIASLAVVMSLLTPMQEAQAAPGDIEASIQVVNNPDGVPVTELRASIADRGQAAPSLMGFNIGYSCGGATDCLNAKIVIGAMPLDPYYGTYRFASYSSATLPVGATLVNSGGGTYTVNLGNLASGSSGTFLVLYNFQSRPVGSSPQSFFPDGYIFSPAVTISADGLDPVTRDTSVTWRIDTPVPAVDFAATSVARVDQDYTYTLYMSARCLWERSTAGHGEPAYECAEEYETVQTLPAGALFVSASHGGQYDAGTVTWSDQGITAATGWGSLNSLGTPRTVTVRFPAAMFTDPAECVINVTSQLDVDMTYLSGAQDSASATRTHEVNACTPFASATLEKFTSRNTGPAADPIVWEAASNYWTARLLHRSNVPAVATIVDNDLDQPGLPVTRISLPQGAGEITATLDNGDIVVTTGSSYTAPTGTRIVAATVVSETIIGPNKVEEVQTASTTYSVRYHYTVEDNVPDVGYQRSNTASATLEFPGTPELGIYDVGSSTETVTVLPRPAVLTPRMTRTVVGGGNPVPGTIVDFGVWGETSYQDPDVAYEPQYVFVAPPLWEIIPGSASIPGLSDELIEYKTVTIDGVSREAVFAHRPAGTVWGVNETWPTMNVQATPTASAPASSVGRANFYMGDAAHNYLPTTALWGSNNGARYVDAADLDGDGDATESYAWNYADTTVGAASALRVLKEICLPDTTAADGCQWLSDPSVPVGIAPDTTDITYRVTISNGGTTTLSGVTAYDVLPHLNDMGTSQASASTPRGSTFDESLSAIESSSPAISLTFSTSTNPCRDEVYPAAPACDPDWAAAESGAKSIRATLSSGLAAGASVTFSYSASVVGTPAADAIACNSVAASSAQTPTTEPQPVCAIIESADLAISVPDRLPLQAGRPGVLPFDVTNLSGTALASGSVGIDVPTGLTVTTLSIDGWQCAGPSAAPLAGPARVECTPIDEFGDRQFAVGVTERLELPVIPDAAVAQLCVPADVAGALSDPALANNTTSGCFAVLAGRPALDVSKDDGQTIVTVGDQFSYTIRAANMLVGENVTDVAVTDELPDGLIFVSASDGGVITGQGADDGFGNLPGGTVTWTVASLGSSGVVGPDGETASGAAGSTVELTITVRVAPLASGTVTNIVTAEGLDPADASVIDATASDVDDVVAALAPAITKTIESLTQADSGVWTTVYRIEVANPNAQVPVAYDLSDSLAFGSGISVSSAAVTTAPVGVTTSAWSGSGVIASDVVLPQAATHSYLITVAADGGAVTGTAAAECATGVAGGFANQATLTLADSSTALAEVCAAPVEPTLTKAVIGAAVQNGDGTWTVSYLLTVSNPHPAPATGLAYTLDDSLSFPAGVDVRAVSVTAPSGITSNSAFTGGLALIDSAAVTADSSIVDGVARIPAGTTAAPSVQEFRVDVTLVVSEGSVAASDVVCGIPGAGYGNWAALYAGDSATILGEATACADIRLPELRFTKSVDRSGSVSVGMTLTYTIMAANVGDAAFTSADPARLIDDMTGVLDDGAYNNDAVVTAGDASFLSPVLDWSGPIDAGETVAIRYTVTLQTGAGGDREAVNVVAKEGAVVPPTGVPDCVADAVLNSDDFCAVRLSVTASSLVLTGADGVGKAALIGALALGLGGLLLAFGMRRMPLAHTRRRP